MIRVGYAGRNPLRAEFWKRFAGALKTFDQYGEHRQLPNEASKAAGFNIIGISGVGKSLSVERILNLYPQVIHHGQYRERSFINSQVVWVKLDCPFDGSVKGLCVNFFQAIDDMLTTNYRRNYAHNRRTSDEMLPDMALLAANHFLGVAGNRRDSTAQFSAQRRRRPDAQLLRSTRQHDRRSGRAHRQLQSIVCALRRFFADAPRRRAG
ncbi:MAG: AAA family ATPase [Blastocatellia bacterium]